MPDTGSSPAHVEKDLALASASGLVSPRSSHHASRSSTPAPAPAPTPALSTSTLDARPPRYLTLMPNPPRPGSAPPPSRADMATQARYLLQPNAWNPSDVITREMLASGQALPPPMHRPQHPRMTGASPTAPSTMDLDDVPCLSEISHLLRVQKYHKRRCIQAQEDLHRLQLAASKTARLRLAAPSVQHTLADCIRSEDKASFANLLHAFQDACEDVSKSSLPPAPGPDPAAVAAPKPFRSFLSDMSTPSRRAVLDTVAKLRYDGHFVAERLTALTPKELLALLPERVSPKSGDSVFASPSRTSRTSRPLGFAVDAQAEVLNACSYGSPLEALVCAAAPFLSTDHREFRRATDIWATVCAKIITEQQTGSEKLVPALLDIWSKLAPWPGHERFETWMLQTLQRGAFLVDPPHKQTFRARIEGRLDAAPAADTGAEAFYTDATNSLLELFGDQTVPSAIPPGALSLCHAIFHKLRDSPSRQRALPLFLLTRWLFSSFVMHVINLPEAHLMLTDHYVSDTSRQRILREVVVRAQKAVFDVAYYWKHGNVLVAETVHRVHAIMARLSRPTPSTAALHSHAVPGSAPFVVVSLRDVTTILSALYPHRRPMSISSDNDMSKSGVQSSASSISGFSLFRNAKTPDQLPADTPSPVLWPGDVSRTTQQDETTKSYTHDDAEDDRIFREACLELEEVASRMYNGAREPWDVMAVDAERQSLCTMRDKSAEIRRARRSQFDLQQSHACLESLGDSYREIAYSLEALLYKYGPLDPAEQIGYGHSGSTQTWPQLEHLFETAIQDCQAKSDYVGAQRWCQRLHDVHSAISVTDGVAVLWRMLRALRASAQRSISGLNELEAVCWRWGATIHPGPVTYSTHLKPIIRENESLRDKMWYVADVRTSAAYEEVRLVASALRVMGKPNRMAKPRAPQPLRHWSTSRMSSGNMHLKSEAQILDILSARVEHGGPNKLSDDQAKATAQWMQRDNIDNLCRGEERLHKLYLEVRKCVDLVSSSSPSENALLLANTLFARDTSFRTRDSSPRKSAFLPSLFGSTLSSDYLSLSSQLRSNDCLSSTSHTLSNASSRDYLDARSPTLTNRSSAPFWSPAMSEVDSPSSATSILSSHTQSVLDAAAPTKDTPNSLAADSRALDKLRQRVTGLILSDVTSTLFNDGSETDRAFWAGLGLELAQRHFRSLQSWHSSAGFQTPTTDTDIPARSAMMRFDFNHAFENLMQKFSARSNPSTKLACLYDIDRLLTPYMVEQRNDVSPPTSLLGQSVRNLTPLTIHSGSDEATEMRIAGFRNLFAKSATRPRTIFRDLQSIASLLPAAVLQNTPEGKAFTNAAVAVTSLKNEVRQIMVETADSIIAFHSNNRGHGRSSSIVQQERDHATFAAPSPPAEDVARYSMADAAHLLQVTAKEGDTVAQRELATLYLTHPELMDRIIAPFARPKDVFKDELEGKWKKNQDPHRMDPTTMCVAHHWMSLSSRGGDLLAKEYLRQREEMDSF